ncbi:hypothetical protein MRB53_026578 [Persea americana]|uniref:Uncharacterized protein n=1 Tax=Persea americana TaxID=3435 RepID=A0ACC2LJH8_PERAE|nr:hypothetical protein MRB53_026578 [Persea americana]
MNVGKFCRWRDGKHHNVSMKVCNPPSIQSQQPSLLTVSTTLPGLFNNTHRKGAGNANELLVQDFIVLAVGS